MNWPVLFTEFADFMPAASTMPAGRMIAELNEIFAAFGAISDTCMAVAACRNRAGPCAAPQSL